MEFLSSHCILSNPIKYFEAKRFKSLKFYHKIKITIFSKYLLEQKIENKLGTPVT